MTAPECVGYIYYYSGLVIYTPSSQKRESRFTYETISEWIIHAHPMAALGWLIVSVFELLLFILVARKAKYGFWCKRRSKEVPSAHDIMEVMAKDSTNYFIM